MLDYLVDIDKEFLLFLNGLHSSFFDGFMYWISDKLVWIPLYVSMLWPIAYKKRWGVLPVVLCIVLCVLFADQFASGFCKPFFERFRPSHDPEIMDMVHIVEGNRSGLYGFISSHAANTFAVALFTILLTKNWWYAVPVSIWALLNSYSRIYLGVHFPLDILCGALAGVAVAFLCYGIYRLLQKYLPEKYAGIDSSGYSFKDCLPLLLTFAGTLFFICLFASKGFVE